MKCWDDGPEGSVKKPVCLRASFPRMCLMRCDRLIVFFLITKTNVNDQISGKFLVKQV